MPLTDPNHWFYSRRPYSLFIPGQELDISGLRVLHEPLHSGFQRGVRRGRHANFGSGGPEIRRAFGENGKRRLRRCLKNDHRGSLVVRHSVLDNDLHRHQLSPVTQKFRIQNKHAAKTRLLRESHTELKKSTKNSYA